MGPTAANPTNRSASRTSRRSLTLSAVAGLACLLTGCTTDLDNYLQPSQVGRHEVTATSVPILDRIAAIEGPADQYVEYDTIRIDDLRPEASEYRVAAGDSLEVRIWDIIQPGMVEVYPLLVDTRGIITIPQLGEISVLGLTAEQTRETIANVAASLVHNPLVQVTVAQSRKQTFTILGAVAGPGSYFIPAADYRLLEGVTAAGGVAETIPYLYVIRQIPLEAQPTNTGAGGSPQEDAQPEGEQFLELLDDLTGGGSPGVMASNDWQPEQQQPAIDLVEGDAPVDMQDPAPQNASAWIFVNGQWVRAARADAGLGGDIQPDAIVTQRIIKVPIKPLLAGDARYNIVLRAGDIVRVPPNEQGFVYISGEINRPGSYSLPATGPYTLRRAIVSAGDLSPTGIPERCDLTRMIGENRQATIMLNYRAIVEGTQPDVVLKPNDIITVGTTFWAYPLAVFRNGFRATYGFGFLLDRNFGNDVFGAPPTNNTFGR